MGESERLNKIIEQIAAENGEALRHCSVCGEPFIPKKVTQKTCLSEECKLKHARNMQRKWAEENHERAKMLKRESARKARAKKKYELVYKAMLDEKIERIERESKLSEKIKECDGRYGDLQKEETLKSIPKINTEI